MLILTLAAALSAAAAPAVADAPMLKFGDPLAPARAGKLLCQTPDEATKSCWTIYRYAFAADGALTSEIHTRVSADPWISTKMTVPATIRDGLVCSMAGGGETAEVFQDGKPASAEMTARVRKGLGEIYAPLAGKQLCTSFTPKGEGVETVLSLDDKKSPRPEYAIWVDPADGWTVKR